MKQCAGYDFSFQRQRINIYKNKFLLPFQLQLPCASIVDVLLVLYAGNPRIPCNFNFLAEKSPSESLIRWGWISLLAYNCLIFAYQWYLPQIDLFVCLHWILDIIAFDIYNIAGGWACESGDKTDSPFVLHSIPPVKTFQGKYVFVIPLLGSVRGFPSFSCSCFMQTSFPWLHMFCLYLPVQTSCLFIGNDNSIIDMGFFYPGIVPKMTGDIPECRP